MGLCKGVTLKGISCKNRTRGEFCRFHKVGNVKKCKGVVVSCCFLDAIPLELIRRILFLSPNPLTYLSLLLTNSIFISSLTKEDKKKIKKGFLVHFATYTEDYFGLPNGKKHGICYNYWCGKEHTVNNLCHIEKYKNGKRNGPYQSFWWNSKCVWKEGNYKQDKKTGLWIERDLLEQVLRYETY